MSAKLVASTNEYGSGPEHAEGPGAARALLLCGRSYAASASASASAS
jgi:hypothetical protein